MRFPASEVASCPFGTGSSPPRMRASGLVVVRQEPGRALRGAGDVQAVSPAERGAERSDAP